MKKNLAVLAILHAIAGSAQDIEPSMQQQQSFGISGHAMIQKPMKEDVKFDNRDVGHMNKLGYGLRLEANIMLPGVGFGNGAGFAGIGFGYFAPVEDSAAYMAGLANWSYAVPVLGTRKTSMLTYGIRFGYEIPQRFSDFVMLYVGGGLQLARVKQVNIFPEEPQTGFNYERSDFDDDDFQPVTGTNACFEILFGGFYELERFHISAQYSFFYPIGGLSDREIGRHGLNIGIYYPLKRWNRPPPPTEN